MTALIDDLKDAVNPANVPPFRPEMAFPFLTEEMVGRLRAYGDEQTFRAGTVLFRRGEREVDMFVVLDGNIEIHTVNETQQDENEQDENEQDETQPLAVLERLQFSGELDLLNSQRTLVSAVTSSESRLLRIRRQEVQHLMRAEGDIANLLMQAVIWRRIGMVAAARGGIVLVGAVTEPQTIQLQRFLIRNGYPYRLLEPENLKETRTQIDDDSFPVIILSDGHVLPRPALTLLADELGISETPHQNTTYDVVVVGAGPSGLAAAVYAASEGLSTLVIESVAPGGQAGTSSKIENYLGFPTGISGQRLAHRAWVQALKFGVRLAIAREALEIKSSAGTHRLTMEGGRQACARSIVIATGARYRKLSVENYERFENRSIYYAATAMESLLCRRNEVIVVGGGNSAGQAAIFLSAMATHVHLIVRGASLSSTMSQYLMSFLPNQWTEGCEQVLLGKIAHSPIL